MTALLPEGTPTHTVDLGGRPRTLAFTMGALRRLRERLGDKVGDLAENPGLVMEYVDDYVWSMLADREDRDEIAPEDVADLIPFGRIGAYASVVVELVAASVEKREASEEGNPQKAARTRAPSKARSR